MSHKINFADNQTVSTMTAMLVDKLKPKVSSMVKARNKVRSDHQALTDRISKLQERQLFIQEEIQNLRGKGVDQIMGDKATQTLSGKINFFEAEQRENEGWLKELQPKVEELKVELARQNASILEVLREQLLPLKAEAEDQMNRHLHEASRLRHGFMRAATEAIDTVADEPFLSNRLSSPNHTFRLKVDWQRSCFVSPSR
jgi:hypothetical protein